MAHSLVAIEAGAGHACRLSLGLRKFIPDLVTVWHHASAYGIDHIEPKAKFGFEHVPKTGEIIIVGVIAYDYLKKYVNFDKFTKVTIIITDGGYMRRTKSYDDEFVGFNVFCTPCKIQFRKGKVREYIQPFDLSHIVIKKNSELTITHSPFGPGKWREKGTRQITDTVADVKLISGVTWDVSLRMKASSHIFIDQIDHFDGYKFGWRGGIGKSGYEAMLLDCLVISRGEYVGEEIPAPPIAWCNKENFRDILNYWIHNNRGEKIAKQKRWALKYCNAEFQAERILNGSMG